MHCYLEKAKILTLSTLAFNKAKISDVIEILDSYIKILNLTPEMVDNMLMLLKRNYLTIRNLRLAIYQAKFESHFIDTYQWIKPFVGLLYFQMNVFKIITKAF